MKNIFNNRRLIKIKNIMGAIAVIVAVAMVSPGVLSLVYSDGEIITDSDIAAYNSTKYEEEETLIASNGSNGGVFSGFETIPTVTPDPEKSTDSEKNSLSSKIKEIMKEKDAVAPKNPVVSYNTSNKVHSTTAPAPTEIPIAEPTIEPITEPAIEPTSTPIPVPADSSETQVIPEEYVHYHDDGVERFELYDTKTVIESNVLAFAAVPKDEYKDRIISVELVLMYNDVEIQRRSATDILNVLEVFPIDYENTGYYEVELFVTLEKAEEEPAETATPVETETPDATAEPIKTEVLRQLSSVVYIIPENIDGEVIENPLYENNVTEEMPEGTEDMSTETAVPTEEIPDVAEVVQEDVFTEDKKIEDVSVSEAETVQEETPEE